MCTSWPRRSSAAPSSVTWVATPPTGAEWSDSQENMAIRMRQLVSLRDGSPARHRPGAKMSVLQVGSIWQHTTRTPQFAHPEPGDSKTLCGTSRAGAESVLRARSPRVDQLRCSRDKSADERTRVGCQN